MQVLPIFVDYGGGGYFHFGNNHFNDNEAKFLIANN